MPEPAVDIVMRTKNRPLFLARALDDVLAQDYPHWQLILVNDGGAPAEVDAALNDRPDLASKTTVLHLPESVHMAAASNQGVGAGAAEFITIHDDDDTWHPQFLTRTVGHLRDFDDIAVAVRTEIVWERQIGKVLQETGRELFHPLMQEPTYFDLVRFNHMVPISILFRRSAYDEIGPFPPYDAVDDWVFNLGLALTGHFGFIDGQPLAYWHQRPDSIGDTGNSVIDKRDLHIRNDRRARDQALREYVREHGPGALLYLAKYIDERTGELHARLDHIEAQQEEILRLLREQHEGRSKPTWIGRRVNEYRP